MTFLTRTHLPRRTFLRGMGTVLALPILDSMVPAFAATAGPKPPVRLGFVYHPVGMIMDRWTPAAEGAGFEFTPTMKALEPFRENLVVLSGLAQVQGRALGDGPGDHAREGATWLTGVHPKKTDGAGICAGQVYGSSDRDGAYPARDAVTAGDLTATLFHLLGIDHRRLTYRYNGRQFRLTDVSGNVLRPILA